MVKLAIFDMDGTLLNTCTTITHFVNLTLAEYGIPGISEDECKIFVGNGARLLIDRALDAKAPGAVLPREEILERYNRVYDENPSYLTAPYNGIPETLAALRERGVMTAVLSNKPEPTVIGAAKYFFGDVFDAVRGGRDGMPLKPAPDVGLTILRDLSVSPEDMIYIGDTGVDMRTGHNLGALRVLGATWGFRSREELMSGGADVLLGTPADILKYLG